MAVKNFGAKQNSDAVNYSVRQLPNGDRFFATECDAGDTGAVSLTRQKDSPSGKFKAGDVFYCKGGNSISGVIKGLWVRDGYGGGAAKELSIGFASTDESGKVSREFLKMGLLDEKGRVDSNTARFLIALNKADLGEEITLAVHTFKHKAGDKMSDKTDAVWEKDGVSTVMSVYQQHLATQDNPNGRIMLEHADYYNQPTFYVKGKDVIGLKQGEKAPAGALVNYDAEDATAFYSSAVEAVNSKVVKDDKFASNTAPVSEDDTSFGDESADAAARSRVANRP